jgi:hypothetical protein
VGKRNNKKRKKTKEKKEEKRRGPRMLAKDKNKDRKNLRSGRSGFLVFYERQNKAEGKGESNGAENGADMESAKTNLKVPAYLPKLEITSSCLSLKV